MKDCNHTNRLQIRDMRVGFAIKTLNKLNKGQWFNDELIQFCLHLSDKLPHMRVGFSVAIHNDNTGEVLPNPLIWAAKHIEKENMKDEGGQLIFLFPLFLQNNHFILLEVNQINGCIYYYDVANYDIQHIKVSLVNYLWQ
jgi:hypothetical protein